MQVTSHTWSHVVYSMKSAIAWELHYNGENLSRRMAWDERIIWTKFHRQHKQAFRGEPWGSISILHGIRKTITLIHGFKLSPCLTSSFGTWPQSRKEPFSSQTTVWGVSFQQWRTRATASRTSPYKLIFPPTLGPAVVEEAPVEVLSQVDYRRVGDRAATLRILKRNKICMTLWHTSRKLE